jgi:TolB protein
MKHCRSNARSAAVAFLLAVGWPHHATAQPASAKPESHLPPLDLQIDVPEPKARADSAMLIFTAHASGNWDVYTWDFDSAHAPIQRTQSPYDESRPSLAADHTFCIYETVDGKLWQLALTTDASTAQPQQLPFASDQKLDMHPAISPESKRLAVATSLDRTTDDSDLAVYHVDSKTFDDRLELLSYQHYPDWAPDGRHLAFSNLHGRLWTGEPISELWVLRTDSPWARQLTLLDALSIMPRWSPDGRQVAFASNRAGSFDLWLVDPKTRHYTQLTNEPAAETDPVFAPNGASLIYVSSQSGQSTLRRYDLRGKESEPVLPFSHDPTIACKDPDWK